MARQTPGATRRAGARRRGEVPRAASASARHRRARDAHRYLAGGRPVAVAHVPRLGARSVAGTRGCDPQLAAAAELVLAPPRAAPARLPARCDAPGDEALELMGSEHGEPVSDLRVERLGHTTAGPASRKQLAERLLAFAQRQAAVVVQDGMPGEGVMERRELGNPAVRLWPGREREHPNHGPRRGLLMVAWKRKRGDIAVRRDQQPEHPVGPRLGSTRLARTRITQPSPAVVRDACPSEARAPRGMLRGDRAGLRRTVCRCVARRPRGTRRR